MSVWFNEKDVALGSSLLRAIDNGLRISRIGIVLATPALLKSLEARRVQRIRARHDQSSSFRVGKASSARPESCPALGRKRVHVVAGSS